MASVAISWRVSAALGAATPILSEPAGRGFHRQLVSHGYAYTAEYHVFLQLTAKNEGKVLWAEAFDVRSVTDSETQSFSTATDLLLQEFRLRLATTLSIGRLTCGKSDAVGPLVVLLYDPAWPIRVSAAAVLEKYEFRIPEEHSISYMLARENWSELAKLDDDDASRLVSLVKALPVEGACRFFSALNKELAGSSAYRQLADFVLGQLRDYSYGYMWRISASKDHILGQCRVYLGQTKDAWAVELLVADLSNGHDMYTRMGAADALGKIGDQRAIDPLTKAAKEDASNDVRRAARRALSMLRPSLLDRILRKRYQ